MFNIYCGKFTDLGYVSYHGTLTLDYGAPTRAQQSGSRGERSRNGMSETCRCPLRRGEGYGACGDEMQEDPTKQQEEEPEIGPVMM